MNAPPSNRADLLQSFWQNAETVGVKTILQHLLDDMPMSKFGKLVQWVERQQRVSSGAANAEADAIACVIALGEPRARVLELLEAAKAKGASGCNGLVAAMLAERNKR